jgi:hypothetical protein
VNFASIEIVTYLCLFSGVLATGETEKLMITELILSPFIPFTLGGGGGFEKEVRRTKFIQRKLQNNLRNLILKISENINRLQNVLLGTCVH